MCPASGESRLSNEWLKKEMHFVHSSFFDTPFSLARSGAKKKAISLLRILFLRRAREREGAPISYLRYALPLNHWKCTPTSVSLQWASSRGHSPQTECFQRLILSPVPGTQVVIELDSMFESFPSTRPGKKGFSYFLSLFSNLVILRKVFLYHYHKAISAHRVEDVRVLHNCLALSIRLTLPPRHPVGKPFSILPFDCAVPFHNNSLMIWSIRSSTPVKVLSNISQHHLSQFDSSRER